MVASSPTPYYTAIQNALADLVDLTVIVFGSVDGGESLWSAFDDPWGAPRRFRMVRHPAHSVTRSNVDFRTQLSFGVSARLAHLHPDAVVLHSWGPTMLEALAWALVARTPIVLWTESAAATGMIRSGLSDRYRSAFVRRADEIVSIGSLATEYATALGADPARIHQHPLPSALSPRIAGAPLPDRQRVGNFLFVGRMVERKRPLAVVRAFNRVADDHPEITLHMVGDGPLAEQVRLEGARHASRIHMSGRREGADLALAFLDADVFVLPSEREVWGLTVNEALAAGLYVIASEGVGSAVDLVRPGDGTIVPVDDSLALEQAMRTALGADGSTAARARRRTMIATQASPEGFAMALDRAARDAIARRERRT